MNKLFWITMLLGVIWMVSTVLQTNCAPTIKEDNRTKKTILVELVSINPHTGDVKVTREMMTPNDWEFFRPSCDTSYIKDECARKKMLGYQIGSFCREVRRE